MRMASAYAAVLALSKFVCENADCTEDKSGPCAGFSIRQRRTSPWEIRTVVPTRTVTPHPLSETHTR